MPVAPTSVAHEAPPAQLDECGVRASICWSCAIPSTLVRIPTRGYRVKKPGVRSAVRLRLCRRPAHRRQRRGVPCVAGVRAGRGFAPGSSLLLARQQESRPGAAAGIARCDWILRCTSWATTAFTASRKCLTATWGSLAGIWEAVGAAYDLDEDGRCLAFHPVRLPRLRRWGRCPLSLGTSSKARRWRGALARVEACAAAGRGKAEVRKFVVVLAAFALACAAVYGAGSLAEPSTGVARIEPDSPCPATGCASGACHGFDDVPEPDGVHEMTCPEASCASTECHAWNSLTIALSPGVRWRA